MPLAPPVTKADLPASDMIMIGFFSRMKDEGELVIAEEVEFTRKEIIHRDPREPRTYEDENSR